MITITTGLNWISLDVPHDTETKRQTAGIFVDSSKRIDLGEINSWSKVKVKFQASDEIRVEIGPKLSSIDSNDIGNSKGEVEYYVVGNKEISIFIRPPISPSSSTDPYVTMWITIQESVNYSSNLAIILLISFSMYFLRYRKNSGWNRENRVTISDVEKLKARRVYQSNHALCDLCGNFYFGVIDIQKWNRYCSKTCIAIVNRRKLVIATYLSLAGSLAYGWLFGVSFVLFLISIYVNEMDGDDLRYTRYLVLKEKGNVVEDSTQIIKIINTIPTKYIKRLNEEYLVCCYQTARLDEIYCECGRTVPKRLRDFLKLEVFYEDNSISEKQNSEFR